MNFSMNNRFPTKSMISTNYPVYQVRNVGLLNDNSFTGNYSTNLEQLGPRARWAFVYVSKDGQNSYSLDYVDDKSQANAIAIPARFPMRGGKRRTRKSNRSRKSRRNRKTRVRRG
jgi:hypothetical protein